MKNHAATARRYRVVHDAKSSRPWIIERSHGNPHWTEITRFTTEAEARTYLAGITSNQHAHLEKQPP